MKIALGLIIICLSSIGYSQNDTIPMVDSLGTVYILEKTWVPNNNRVFEVDDSPNYFHMNETYSLLTGRVRGTPFYFEGEIDGYEEELNTKKADLIKRFYVRGRQFSIGKLASYEIYHYKDGRIQIHIFQKTGQLDRYFEAHIANSEERQEIINYWNER